MSSENPRKPRRWHTVVQRTAKNRIKGNRWLIAIVGSLLLSACADRHGGYLPASTISARGFAAPGFDPPAGDGQPIALWGYVDHANLYGDAGTKAILAQWWSGEGPSATSWRFNLKGRASDGAGESFPVHAPNDAWRDALLRALLADARAHRPTRVFVRGTVFAFDAPANITTRMGLFMTLDSSRDVRLATQQTN